MADGWGCECFLPRDIVKVFKAYVAQLVRGDALFASSVRDGGIRRAAPYVPMPPDNTWGSVIADAAG